MVVQPRGSAGKSIGARLGTCRVAFDRVAIGKVGPAEPGKAGMVVRQTPELPRCLALGDSVRRCHFASPHRGTLDKPCTANG